MKFSFNGCNLGFNKIDSTENFVPSSTLVTIPENLFPYKISESLLQEHADNNIFEDTGLQTNHFNNVYDLTPTSLLVNLRKSEISDTQYILKFKADDIVFKSKLNNIIPEKIERKRESIKRTAITPGLPPPSGWRTSDVRGWKEGFQNYLDDFKIVLNDYAMIDTLQDDLINFFKSEIDSNFNRDLIYISNIQKWRDGYINYIYIYKNIVDISTDKVEELKSKIIEIYEDYLYPSETWRQRKLRRQGDGIGIGLNILDNDNDNDSNRFTIMVEIKENVSGDEVPNNSNKPVVFLEKMLTEDTYFKPPEKHEVSVSDDIPSDLRIQNIDSSIPEQPEFEFYTDYYYSKLYIRVHSNKYIGNGWLQLNEMNKFIVVNDTNGIEDFSKPFNFILPKISPYSIGTNIKMPILIDDFSSNNFSYSDIDISEGTINSDMENLNLVFQNNDEDSLEKNSMNEYSENNSIYELIFIGKRGVFNRMSIFLKDTDTQNIYITEKSNNTLDPIKFKLFKDSTSNGIYMYIILNRSMDRTIFDTITPSQKNKVWLGISDNGKFQLKDNVYNSFDFSEYLDPKANAYDDTNTGSVSESTSVENETTSDYNDGSPEKETFQNKNNGTQNGQDFIKYVGYNIFSNPTANVSKSTAEQCAEYCVDIDPTNIASYLDKSINDFNCRCYDKVGMNFSDDPNDETILFGNSFPDHTNISNLKYTITAKDATECSTSCQTGPDGAFDPKVRGYVFDAEKSGSNCGCYADNTITYVNGEGKVAGATMTILEEEEDYDPLTKYYETSPFWNFFKKPGMKTLLIMMKIITIVVALILYSYYSHEDIKEFKLIKTIFVIIFSEIYLMYNFVKMVLYPYKKSIHEV